MKDGENDHSLFRLSGRAGKIKPGAKMAAYLANMDLVTVLLH